MSLKDILKLALVALVVALAVMLVSRIGQKQGDEEAGIVKNAVKNALLTCYAVEGAYPGSADYLEEYYQLRYDHERFAVNIRGFSPNILPDIYVTEIGDR